MYKVLILNSFSSGQELLKQTKNSSGVVGEYQFFINEFDLEFDFCIVLDNVPDRIAINCRRENIVLFALESPSIQRYSQAFVDQFEYIVSCQKDIKHKNLINDLTTVFWRYDKDYDELIDIKPLKKTKLISIISSDKVFTPGHKKRLEFAQRLKKDLGDKIDLFGRGINDFTDKWEVIAPYKFSIAIENEDSPNWITEKLTDCFLAYTFPIYFGCSNAEQYFSGQSFTRIDLDNYENSLKIIRNLIEHEALYESKISILNDARLKYLEEHNFFYKSATILDSIRQKSLIRKKTKLSKNVVIYSQTQVEKLNFFQRKLNNYGF